MDNIIFEPLSKKYYNDIKKMICYTWHFDKYIPKKLLKIFINTVFYSYLCECNYSQIAVVDNKVAGVILAHTTSRYFNFRYYMLMIFSALKLTLYSEGRKCFKILKNISVCEKEIKRSSKINKNQLLLLIVDPNLRNLGIGSALINNLQQKCNKYYLITDTLCNYTFYDRKGFQRIKTKSFLYFSGLENMYLYQRL